MTATAAPSIRIAGCSPRGIAAFSRRQSGPWLVAMVAAIVVGLTGCGASKQPLLGTVEGAVTLDGVPLPAARIVFTPDGPGRSAWAVTDTAGRYALSFLRDIAGANVGSHTVRITTSHGKRGVQEILPSRYNRKTSLMATVAPGHNAIDFPLLSK